MFCVVCLLVAVLKKPQPIPDDPAKIQQARYEQFVADSVKYTRIMDAMKTDRNRIDSLYQLKERNNEILWKRLRIAFGIISTMPPDSVNILFTRYSECPPSW